MPFLEVASSHAEAEPLLATPTSHSHSTYSTSLADKRLPIHIPYPLSSARQRVQEHARREFNEFSRSLVEICADRSKDATETMNEELQVNEVGFWNRFVNVVSAIDTFIVKIILNPAPQSERFKKLQADRELDPTLRYHDWHLDNPTPEPSESGSDIEHEDTFPRGYAESIADDSKPSDERPGESSGDFIAQLSSFVGNLEKEVRELRSQLWEVHHSVNLQGSDDLAAEFDSLCWTYIQSEPSSPVIADFMSAGSKPPRVATMQRSMSCSDLYSRQDRGL